METFLMFIFSLSVLYFLSLLIHVFFYVFNLWDKIAITIKLPKNKKYNNKVDPIYEIKTSINDSVFIYKWSLQYQRLYSFLLLIIPYPIIIKKFGYYIEDNVYICELNDVPNLSNDLKTLYENKLKQINEENKPHLERQKQIENKFKTLNEIFNQNHE